jgi:uncharacterized lipoprotein YajG
MEINMKRQLIKSLFLVIMSSIILVGCDDKQKQVKAFPHDLKKYTQQTSLEGMVSNNKANIKAGTLKVSDNSGRFITETELDNGHFRVDIPANTVLPILLTALSAADSEQLTVAVIDDKITKYQINPTTTAIVKAAKAMGGYTKANMVRAAEETVHVPDSNKTSSGWKGDPTTQYGGWH